MRITVFGASGGVGRAVVEQALAEGHDVVAAVRDPARLGVAVAPRLTVRVVELSDADGVRAAVAGSDAVVSALGARTGTSEPTSVCTDGMTAITTAMRQVGVRRVVAISAATVTYRGDDPFTRLVVKPILRRVLRHPMRDSAAMEEVLATSGLDWTVLRPPMLTDGPRTGRYRSRSGANVLGGFRISRADVGDAVLRALATTDQVGVAVGVAA